ncbi:MAG: hypothetical protein SGPRY_007610 [Prymnesium sp.]
MGEVMRLLSGEGEGPDLFGLAKGLGSLQEALHRKPLPSSEELCSVASLLGRIRREKQPEALLGHIKLLASIDYASPAQEEEALGTPACSTPCFQVRISLEMFSRLCGGYDVRTLQRKRILATVGGIAAVIGAMREHLEERSIQLAALSTLASVCHGHCEASAYRKDQADYESILHEAIMAISCIASGSTASSAHRKKRAISSGALGMLTQVLELHMSNKHLAHDCLFGLYVLYSIDALQMDLVRSAPYTHFGSGWRTNGVAPSSRKEDCQLSIWFSPVSNCISTIALFSQRPSNW